MTFDFITRNRIRLSVIIIAAFLAEDIIEGLRPHSIDSLQDLWGLVGLSLVLSGVGLRSWAAGILRKDKYLATTGPYSLMRHPLYVGSLFMGLGFSLIIGDEENIWTVLGMAIMLYYPKIREEEIALAKLFEEEWKRYTKYTSMLIPKSIHLNLSADWSLTQWLRNREYRALVVGTAGLFILELIHEMQILRLLTSVIR